MIDTIKIVSYKYNQSNYKPDIKLDRHTEYSKTGNASYTYPFKNMTLSLSQKKITIQGSLTKYLMGHNINLKFGSCKDFKDAIDKLGNYLKLDLSDFRITRIDFGRCFVVAKAIDTYLDGLVALKEHTWTQHGCTGKEFHNSVRRLTFYDKQEQIRALAEEERESAKRLLELINLNEERILRYELQIHDPESHYNRILRVKDILDEECYYAMVLLPYYNTYLDIEKGHNMDVIDFTDKGPRELKDIFSLYGILQYGETRFRNGVAQLKKGNAPNIRRKYNAYLAKLRDLKKEYSFAQDTIDILGDEIRKSIHQPASMPESNLILTDEIELYNFILSKVKLLRKRRPDLQLNGILVLWKSLILDKKFRDEVLALQIVKEIQEIKEISNVSKGITKIIQEDAYINAVDIMRGKDSDKFTRKKFKNITLVDFLNMVARRCKLRT